ncbi:PaaI family thioesterase [Anaerotignum sp.]|uniref:PaaI family thioesterase n=1 Tax=Anaerotignum sp. TaxID=2039241 RepID=UPI0027146849|nr:PaaI family thioesterase [Anaerotignum sp.]
MKKNKNLNQGDMEAWFTKINAPDFYMREKGVLNLLDPKFKECNFEKKELVLSFEVKDWELNPEGGLHGGIIVTGFDMTFGLLCHYFEKPNMVCTVNLSTTYIQPVLPDDTVEYHARIISQGKNMISLVGEARLTREHILAATATTTYMILNKQLDIPE